MVERRSPKPKVVGSIPTAPAIFIYKYMKAFSELLNYFGGVKKEFKHIRFLSKKEVYQISLMVIVCVIIFSIVFSFFDLIVSSLIRFVVGF